MDISADVDKIISQAPDWNFAGDCALLALMKRISQNLQDRGEKTSRNLRDFETSVKQVDISLNNATNSLRSLQFGNQFVEYRVEEVDDADLAMPEEKKKKPQAPSMSSEEMAKEFLENNLRMFRKNYEPVTIEVPDSDDEDAPVHSTTVFRAKNPYDAIPLPYVIGTKEWEEHKYAGLYDSKENSEDERSEEFSSSSSDERESVTKKITVPTNKLGEPHLSDSSSLASFAREPAIVSPVIKPASQVPEAANRTQPRPIISSHRNPHERDMFSALRQSPPSDDPPSTSSSPTSSPAFRNPSSRLPIVSTASLSSSSSSPAQQPARLFDEAVSTQIPKETDVKSNQTKRMPVNLFNDDEFKSFMSEIVDKVQAKSGSSSASTGTTNSIKEPQNERKSLETKSKPEATKPIVEKSVPKHVNLFDDSPPLSPTPKAEPILNSNKSSGAIPKQSPALDKNSQAKSLFDNSPTMVVSPKEIPSKKPTTPLKKSLFDDDLEDDDFLNSFTSKTKPEQKTLSKPKSSLFDDDDLDIDDIFIKPSVQPKKLSEKVAGKTSLFEDDDQDDVTDLFGSKKTKETRNETLPDTLSGKNVEESPPDILPDLRMEATVAPKKSLFDDIDDDDIFGTPKAKNLITTEQYNAPQTFENTEIKIEKQKEIGKHTEEMEVNSSMTNIRDSPPPLETLEDKSKQVKCGDDLLADEVPRSTNLFTKDLSDHESFLNPLNIKVKTTSDSETKEFIKTAERDSLQANENIVSIIPPESSTKPTDLFNEDISDDKTFLSTSKHKEDATATTEINISAKVELVDEIKQDEPQKLPENKIDSITIVDEKDDVVPEVLSKPQRDVLVSESPPPDDYQSEQDPIITMVADVTNKSPEGTPRKPADLAAAQQIMQNYSNLFSDEPPDDSEFFQALGGSGLSSLSASKIFDNEHDFFEPALPKIPNATKPSPVTPGDQPSSASDYGAMCLFSDIPPEDDDREGEEAQKQPVVQKDELPPTRIHTIFYDDFSETARAGGVQPIPKRFSFDDEPPPADEPDRSKVNESPELPPLKSPVKKLKMPNININVQALLPGSGGLPKVLRKQESSSSEREEPPNTAQSTEITPSSKENVIPPGEGGLQHVNKSRARGPAKRRPSTRKGRKENYAKSLMDADLETKSSTSIQGRTSIAKPDVEHLESKTFITHIPQSVRDEKMSSAPPVPILNVRPEIKPQIEIPAPPKVDATFLDSPDEDDSFFTSVPSQANSSNRSIGGKQGSDPPKSYRSFLDSPDQDDLLFKPFESKGAIEKASVPFPQSVSNEATADHRKLVQSSEPPNLGKSFSDSPDEDDSLFSAAVMAPAARKASVPAEKIIDTSAKETSAPTKEPNAGKEQITPKPQSVPKLFDDSDDDDDIFASAAVPASLHSIQTTVKPVQAKPPIKPAATSLFSSDDDDELVVPAKSAPAKKLPLKKGKSLFSDDDDDDDLFGGGSASKVSAIKKTNTVIRTASKPATGKAPNATPTIPSKSSDNPLADLLDSE
ncbi:WASH complex subunit 2 [Drosophila eugracilis]|uniref:WASH complex subunit 2 n=1 Tax=Drosophila eugracilis TaxID=29029 RepID=UPI0007E5D352|nr:WASH complex subunit 2 [Drosophila eugracilis]